MVSERSFLSLHSQNDQISHTQCISSSTTALFLFFIATKIAPRVEGRRGGATFTSESLCTKLARRLRHKIRVVVWLVQEVFRLFFFKEANTDSTMLKSRQLAVDFCPQASQSDGAHGDDTTTQILTLCERCR